MSREQKGNAERMMGVGDPNGELQIAFEGGKNRDRVLGKRCRISVLWIGWEGQGKTVPAQNQGIRGVRVSH